MSNEPIGSSDLDDLDVLLVDDEVAVAESTAEVLASAGLRVGTSATLDEALRVLAMRSVGTVILDHHLSGGAESERDFLTRGRRLPPVILMSGLDLDALAEIRRTYADHIVACLAKPVPPQDLIAAVRSAIRRH